MKCAIVVNHCGSIISKLSLQEHKVLVYEASIMATFGNAKMNPQLQKLVKN